jgi:hypothetical protein
VEGYQSTDLAKKPIVSVCFAHAVAQSPMVKPSGRTMLPLALALNVEQRFESIQYHVLLA